jgi:hypothetical protein
MIYNLIKYKVVYDCVIYCLYYILVAIRTELTRLPHIYQELYTREPSSCVHAWRISLLRLTRLCGEMELSGQLV